MDQHVGASLAGEIRRWQTGWARCRGVGPAIEVGDALGVHLGLPGRDREFVALHADDDPDSVRRLAAEVSQATGETWLTVPTCRGDTVAAVLAAAGLELITNPERLMTVDLQLHPLWLTPPAPYRAETAARGPVIEVLVRLPDGEVAARGTMAVTGSDAVAHNIQTEAAHRRRGLASVVMATLCRAATERGATTGLLIASPEGERLYTALGWTPLATVLTARGAAPARAGAAAAPHPG